MPNLDTSPPAADTASRTAISEVLAPEAFPTSFGAFNPVGHVMVGSPLNTDLQALTRALHGAG
jgi:hypothetical protein